MKKIFIVLFLFYSQVCFSYQDIKLLDGIDLHLKSNPKKAITSLLNYNDARCVLTFVKKGDRDHTWINFNLSDNLSDLYEFLNKFDDDVSIRCKDYMYRFKTKLGYQEYNVIYNLDICKNKIISNDINIFLLSHTLHGEDIEVLENLKMSFVSFSNKPPITTNYDLFQTSGIDGKKYKNIYEKTVWKDRKKFNNDKEDIHFAIVARKEYAERHGKDKSYTSIQASIRDFGYNSRTCF